MDRPADPQTLLRLFSAGLSPRLPRRLEALRRPAYRTLNARPITFAGDGSVFLWTYARVPGFRDYEVPVPAEQFAPVAEILTSWKPGQGTQLPEPSRAAPGVDVWMWLGKPARIRRADLARLALLDTCEARGLTPLPPASASGASFGGHGGGGSCVSPGWASLALTWRHGTLSGHGVLLCAPSRTRRRIAPN